MGGRGASSGWSRDKHGNRKNKYGSQYHTILQYGNIKFVQKNDRNSETLMETMTKGRVYVTVGGDELISIIYFDTDNKRVKAIDMNHPHKGMQPHTHHGYNHNEYDNEKGATNLTTKEREMVARVEKTWDNYLQKQRRGVN